VSNPKLATLIDAFNEAAIASLWNNVTAGAATLDTVNDLVVLAQPTTNGSVNTFGSNSLYDATSSQIYAQIVPAAVGNGHTNTIFKLLVDSNNSVAIRLASGTFEVTLQTAGTTVATTLTTYSPDAHRWWRLRESAGTLYADFGADGFNWTNLWSNTYTWSATAMMFVFQASASATEVAGNAATIQHVNTMLGGPFNLNWPRLEEGWGAQWTCNGGDSPLDAYVDLTPRSEQQTSISRGKQYELDQVRSSEADAVWENLDGALDPVNTAGPYAGHIMPYQPWRRRMMWPPSRNILSQVMATGGDLGGYPLGTINSGEDGPDIFSYTDPTNGSFVSTATAWQGGTVIQCSVPSGTAIGGGVMYTKQPAVVPGAPYTGTIWVRNITASTTVQVQGYLAWTTVTGSLTFAYGTATTLTGGGAWTQLTVTGTAPSTATSLHHGVLTTAVPSATCSVQGDGWQVEEAATASSWTCPGIWYPVLSGFTENWESDWDMGGTYGTIQATGVDALALISQVQLTDPLTQEITSNSPRFLFTLGDPEGTGQAADTTGTYQPAPILTSKYGPGSFTFGADITATSESGTYIGSSGTVAAVANPNPGADVGDDGSSYLSLNSVGITGPANVTVAWTRMCAWRYSAGSNPSAAAYFWSSMDEQRGAGVPGGSIMYWLITSTGQFSFGMNGPSSGGTYIAFTPAPTNAADGNWHLAIVSYSSSNATLVINLDGTNYYWVSVGSSTIPTGLTSDNFGAYVDVPGGGFSTLNFAGNLSYCAEFPTALSSAAMVNLYDAWKSACAGESSDQRYARILRYSGYTGNTNLQAGLTTDMGPATDLAGTDGLSALQSVTDTENGQHFVSAGGTVTFQARSARYNALTPTYIFGENTAAGEIPYETCVMPLDPTHIGNIVQVTQTSTNQIFTAQDATSQGDYFPRTLTRTINAAQAVECQAAAYYLLSRYKQPAERISELTLHPSANPAIWPVCLSLELGMRITVNRRPPLAPEISIPAFVENMAWQWDDGGEATLVLQCSPVDLTPYGLFSAFTTTLHSTIAANVGSITINAGYDNTNLAAAQLGVGQQLVLSEGLSTQETVTVKAVAATSPGWTTCVITLVSNTVNAHTAGDTVCEPLPTGVTNPATWDASSVFGESCFAY
jgi:hypothetical protein